MAPEMVAVADGMSSSSESLITKISLVSSLTSSPRFTASVASATIS